MQNSFYHNLVLNAWCCTPHTYSSFLPAILGAGGGTFSPPAVVLGTSCTGGTPQTPCSPLGGTGQRSCDPFPSGLQFMPMAEEGETDTEGWAVPHSPRNAVPEADTAQEASGEQLKVCCLERPVQAQLLCVKPQAWRQLHPLFPELLPMNIASI